MGIKIVGRDVEGSSVTGSGSGSGGSRYKRRRDVIKTGGKQSGQHQANFSQFAPANIESINESSELSDTIKELNEDSLNSEGFSSIDMKTRLNVLEISSLIAIDSMIALNFLPREVSFITRSKKRLAVSQLGKGRDEIVGITKGLRDEKQGTTAFGKIRSLFESGGGSGSV